MVLVGRLGPAKAQAVLGYSWGSWLGKVQKGFSKISTLLLLQVPFLFSVAKMYFSLTFDIVSIPS